MQNIHKQMIEKHFKMLFLNKIYLSLSLSYRYVNKTNIIIENLSKATLEMERKETAIDL